MFKVISSIVFLSLVGGVSYFVTEGNFSKPETHEYFLAQPQLGLNEKLYLGIQKHYEYFLSDKLNNKQDLEYRFLYYLNDNKALRNFASSCNAHLLEQATFPSRFLLIKRSKIYHYVTVSFSNVSKEQASCILQEFNTMILDKQKEILLKEKVEIERLVEQVKISYVKSELLKRLEYINVMLLMKSQQNYIYEFSYWGSENYDGEKTEKKLKAILIIISIGVGLFLLLRKAEHGV